MGEYPSDCPEPRPEMMFRTSQQLQGQYEQQVQQFIGTPNPKQLGSASSTERSMGILGKENQQN